MQRKKISFAILAAIVGVGPVLSGCGEEREVIPTASSNAQGQPG
jgi:putative aldouronate transport system substrate-binding protein